MKILMRIPPEIDDFLREHQADPQELTEVLADVQLVMPTVKVNFDPDTYGKFGVLRVEACEGTNALEPLLFGSVENLSALNRNLWEASSSDWAEEMSDVSQRGTFLKRAVLIPAVLSAVRRHTADGGTVLDLGCGDGVVFHELLSVTPRVYGIDFAAPFIEKLRRKYPNVRDRLLVRDATDLDLSQPFDTVVACMLLLGIPEVDRALEEIYQVLCPNGVVVIADANSLHHRTLGYYGRGGQLVKVHDPTKCFRVEKKIGGGAVRAIHNHRPFSYYRTWLEKRGMTCIEDIEVTVTAEQVRGLAELDASAREQLLGDVCQDIAHPPFHLLVMRKNVGIVQHNIRAQ
jgi:ubiquinone/menaquinone biosynthesis C-methylase UbiE